MLLYNYWHKGVARSVLWAPGNVKKSRLERNVHVFDCLKIAKFRGFWVNLTCEWQIMMLIGTG